MRVFSRRLAKLGTVRRLTRRRLWFNWLNAGNPPWKRQNLSAARSEATALPSRHYDRESIREMIGAVPGRIAPAGRSAAFIAADPESAAARNGAARPAGGIYEAAALLYQELSGTGSDDSAGKTDSSTTQQNVEFRRLSGKMTAGISAVFSDILNSAQYGLNNPRYQVERRIPDRIFRENVLGKAGFRERRNRQAGRNRNSWNCRAFGKSQICRRFESSQRDNDEVLCRFPGGKAA